MAQRDDDDPGKPKPLFVPPSGAKPGAGGSSLFAPPIFTKPGGLTAPTIVPAKAPPSASSSTSSSSLSSSAFGEWPTELELSKPTPAEPAAVEPTPVEPTASEPDRPSAPMPDDPTAPIEIKAEPEPEPKISTSDSGPRAPLHARKTSTQAHAVVGEFGVPSLPSGSRPSTPIVEGKSRGSHDEDDELTESRDDLLPRPPVYDDTEETDEEPKPLPIQPRVSEPPPPAKRGSMPLLIGLGLAAALAVGFFVSTKDHSGDEVADDRPKPNRKGEREVDKAAVSESPTRPRPPDEVRTDPGDPEAEALRAAATTSLDTDESEGESEASGGEPTKGSDTSGGEVDPRDRSVIPPGTSEEAIKAFTKLPVSVHDGPPLGGIGRTGIHVDAISTGSEVRNGTCLDEATRFSLALAKEVSVCFRVVHDREEESVRVLWDKDGTTVRRGSVRIRDLHAYKTRAYLELRPEYGGKWRVRVISEDDVELASHEFEIQP